MTMYTHLRPNSVETAEAAQSKPTGISTQVTSKLYVALCIAVLIGVNVKIFPTWFVAILSGLCVVVIWMSRRGLARLLLVHPLLLALPSLYVASTLWSDEMTITARLGLETFLTILTGIAIGHAMPRKTVLFVVATGLALTVLGCVASGKTGPSQNGAVLIGFLGSKDSMGLTAYAGLMASMAFILDRNQRKIFRLAMILAAILELYISLKVHAAAALVSVLLGVPFFLGFYFVISKSQQLRWLFYGVGFVLLIAMAMFYSEAMDFVQNMVFRHLGKDPTLTGRTIIWSHGFKQFLDSPVLGHGYRAFWAGSSLDAHMLLSWIDVGDGRGFHFHEQYLEVLVDAGLLGFVFFLSIIFIFVRCAWKDAISERSAYTSYALTMLVLYLPRWFGETNFMPYSMDTMLIYMVGTAALQRAIQRKHEFHDRTFRPLLNKLDNSPSSMLARVYERP